MASCWRPIPWQIHWFTLYPPTVKPVSARPRNGGRCIRVFPRIIPKGAEANEATICTLRSCYFTYRGLIEVAGDGEAQHIHEVTIVIPWYRVLIG